MVDNNESKKRVVLITLDGWGAGLAGPANIFNEETAPKLSALLDSYPYTQLATCASDLGYGKQAITDSKIGHLALSLAAPLEKKSGGFFKEEELAAALKQLKQKESDCHVLLDARNIEALDDFKWCVTLAERKKIKQVCVHLLLSEVDNFDLTVWQALIAGHDNIKIIQLIKADYALNDSYEWEKTALAYRAVVEGESNDAVIKKIEATKMVLAENDVVLFLGRELSVWFQLASSLTAFEFGEFERKLPSGLKCLSVDGAAKQRGSALPKLLAQHDLKQVVITESYGAIAACYYGGGLACSPEAGQDWVIFNSPLYSELPNEILESSEKVIDYSIDLINDQDYDFVHINLATLDLARQCGDVELVTRCLEALDKLSARVIKAALDRNFLVLLGSTCSGSEAIVDVVSGTQTIKNTNALVPFAIIASELEGRSFSSLEGVRNEVDAAVSHLSLLDIAPTVLAYFNIHQPSSMSGKSLI